MTRYFNATLFQNNHLVGYRRMECRWIDVPAFTSGATSYVIHFIEKGKRTVVRSVDDGTYGSVVVEGWDWPDLPPRFSHGLHGEALFSFADEGWEHLFDDYLTKAQEAVRGTVILDLRCLRELCPRRGSISPPEKSTTGSSSVEAPLPKYSEGDSHDVILTRFERDAAARQACIDFHGDGCIICGFRFIEHYGELGHGFIHVHHLSPISESLGDQPVDPHKDLMPVCPNCHAMLHRQNPPLSIDALREIIGKIK